jgi:glycosyltransferase involved in cell wall biosynthesis
MTRSLRVHLLGNTCNNHFTLARYLRDAGVDAHLFYNADLHWQTLPESEEPSVADDRPEWLHPYGTADAGPTPFAGASPALAAAIGDCDLIQAEDVGLVWAAQSGRPYLWYPYGYDLNVYPFQHHWYAQWSLAHPDLVLASVAYRQAIAGAAEVLFGLWYKPLAHGFDLLKQLLPPDRFVHDIQLAIDADRFRPAAPGTDGTAHLQALLAAEGITMEVAGLRLFHPTRVMFTEASYVNKANDRLFHALAGFRAQGGQFTLVMVERGIPDEEAARDLFSRLGITDRIAWIPARPRHALVPWYQAAEIVPDEFIGGSLGSVSFEAMSCGATLLTRLATSDADPTYWPPTLTFPELPPVWNASTEEEITATLREAADDPIALDARRRATRAWALRWVAGPRVAERLTAVYERILMADRRDVVQRGHGWGRGLPSRLEPSEVTLRTIDTLAPAEAISTLSRLLDDGLPDARVLWALVTVLARAGHMAVARFVAAHAAALISGSSIDAQWSAAHGVTQTADPSGQDTAELADIVLRVEAAIADGQLDDAMRMVELLVTRDPANNDWRSLLRELQTLVQTR